MTHLTRRQFLKSAGMTVTSLGILSVLPKFVLADGPGGTDTDARVWVRESCREIPIAYSCDVAIVGGGTGAVAAALAAAKAGASVFLATPYRYLGEDLCAGLRLWLENGETVSHPLAVSLFGPKSLPFTYSADKPASAAHPDSIPAERLMDGKWASAQSDSVQFDGPVTLTVTLSDRCAIKQAGLMAYHALNFKLASITIESSEDQLAWHEEAVITNTQPDQGRTDVPALAFTTPLAITTRYLRFSVTPSADTARLLLGEIVIDGQFLDLPTPTPAQWVGTPLQFKRTLDQALLDADVDFLYNCYATDILYDVNETPCGIVMANRAGRQAILAKTIIDATDRAWVARQAGAEFSPYPAGPQRFRRTVIGAPQQSRPGILSSRPITSTRFPSIYEYTLEIPMEDGSHPAWAKAEQAARALTYHPEQQRASDTLFQVPPDAIQGVKSAAGEWSGVATLDLDAFRPKGIRNFFVLGGCADLARAQAERLLYPMALIEMGDRIGAAAAQQALDRDAPRGIHLQGGAPASPIPGEVSENLVGVRPNQSLPGVPQDVRSLPVWGTYDVVVVGGGVSGAPAGIGAARQGAKTLVIDFQHALGGIGTLGLIGVYYYGHNAGFTAEVPGQDSWNVEQRMEWWRSQLRAKNADIWLNVVGCGALIENGRVAGVVVATPQGRGVVRAKVVVDATGNADIAAAAGASCTYTADAEIAIQGTGLPPRELNDNYRNTDFTIVDETDLLDTWHVCVYSRRMHGNAFDSGQHIDTRERRRIVGECAPTISDVVNGRTYPDTIGRAFSDFDSHGYTIDPFFEFKPLTGGTNLYPNIPYRSLLPKGLEGILVVGLGISVHRDVVPVIRMQRDVQNLGYAAGVAAAMAVAAGVPLCQLDIKGVQRHLVSIGALLSSVLSDTDPYPYSSTHLQTAVMNVATNYQDISVLLSHAEQTRPRLREAFQKATQPTERLIYAHVLAVMGDASGLESLIEAVNGFAALDTGWNYTGLGQYGACMSRLDSLVAALGRTRDPRALPAILAKLELLDAHQAFSHHRMFALALEKLGQAQAAPHLAQLLAKPDMQGHAIHSIDQAAGLVANNPKNTIVRERSYREIMLARALYRCADDQGLGRRILTDYTTDLRGHFARHAYAILHPPTSAAQDWTGYE